MLLYKHHLGSKKHKLAHAVTRLSEWHIQVTMKVIVGVYNLWILTHETAGKWSQNVKATDHMRYIGVDGRTVTGQKYVVIGVDSSDLE